MIGIGLNITKRKGASWVPQDETATYITGLVTPLSASQILLIDDFIIALKTGLNVENLSDVFDAMYLKAGETQESCVRNIISNAFHLTKLGPGTLNFTPYEGLKGDGDCYLTSSYKPLTDSNRVAQNSVSVGCYIMDNINSVTADIGCWDNLTNSGISIMLLSNTYYVYLNNTGQTGIPVTDTRGMFIASRSNATTINLYINGGNKVTQNYNSLPLVNGEINILARGGDLKTTRRQAFSFWGKDLSDADVLVITNAIEAYMDANGKGVIT